MAPVAVKIVDGGTLSCFRLHSSMYMGDTATHFRHRCQGFVSGLLRYGDGLAREMWSCADWLDIEDIAIPPPRPANPVDRVASSNSAGYTIHFGSATPVGTVQLYCSCDLCVHLWANQRDKWDSSGNSAYIGQIPTSVENQVWKTLATSWALKILIQNRLGFGSTAVKSSEISMWTN